jgi:NAD(P)H-hydrate epimerase
MGLNKRNRASTKGKNGRVLILGGSRWFTGAPILSAQAVLRSGSDLAVLFVPSVVKRMATDPEIIVRSFWNPCRGFYSLADVGTALELAKDCDCVLLGPGMTTKQSVHSFVNRFVLHADVPMVLDADALKTIDISCLKEKRCILTPHAWEFEAMFGEHPTEMNVKVTAHENRVILLKGQTDLISDGKQVHKNTTGNAGLTVGGTGDILAGVVASFIAQGNTLADASYYAAVILGKCADALYKTMGYNYTPSDILSLLPTIVKKFNS